MTAPKLTFGSLFAGIGGIDLGFERAGLECKWQVEIDDYATRVLAKHWPNVRRHNDVRTWPAGDTERVDVIAGGFPCQDISYAGNGAGLSGERSGLFYEAIRVVREVGPRFVVLENVAALLTRGLDQVLGTLASIGFDAEWHCIPAASVGAPHIRDRVFVIAYSNGRRFEKLEECDGEQEARRETQQRDNSLRFCDDVADSSSYGRNERQSDDWRSEQRASARQEHLPNGCGSVQQRDWWKVEPAVGRVVDGLPRRVDRLRGLGNAVVPQVAEWIGQRLIELSAAVQTERNEE